MGVGGLLLLGGIVGVVGEGEGGEDNTGYHVSEDKKEEAAAAVVASDLYLNDKE